MQVAPGSTDVSIDIRAMTAAGAALTGKVAADFTAWYRRDAGKVAIVLSDLPALTDPHDDGGLAEIGDGWYRLDVPDAAFAAGTDRAAIGGTVDGGVVLSAPVVIETLAAAILADTGTDGVVVAAASKTGYALSATGADLITSASTFAAALADAILKRSVSNVEATASQDSLAEIILAILHSAIVGATWTIKRTDDATTFEAKTVTSTSAADPITGVSG